MMNLYRIDTEEGYQVVVAEKPGKASWLVLVEWQGTTRFGLDNPFFITSRRLLLKDVEGPARVVNCREESDLVERGFAAIGQKVKWFDDEDYEFVAYDPKDYKCYNCGQKDDLLYVDGVWQCEDYEVCFRGQSQLQGVKR